VAQNSQIGAADHDVVTLRGNKNGVNQINKLCQLRFPLPCAAAALTGILLALGGGGCKPLSEDVPDLIVLQTGRIRGNVYPTSMQAIAPLQPYPYVAGYVKQVREEAARVGAQVLLVDLGDSLSGSFASYATDYGNMVAFFNALKYDAIILGNLDNNVLPGILASVEAEVLNPFSNTAGEPATEGTQFGVRLDLNGQPAEILANFYGDTSRSQYPDRFPTWFGNTGTGVVPLRDYSKVVESLGPRPAGTFTALTWMKFESPKKLPAEFLKMLTDLGVDFILAHRIYSGRKRDIWAEKTFYDWTPPVSENILRNNGGFTIARTDLKRDGDSWSVMKQELVPMTANTATRDDQVIEEIAQYTEEIEAADIFIANLPNNVSEEDILISYLTALSQLPDTEVAVYSRNSVRTSWPAGRLTASRVFNSLPWTTALVQMTLTPDQLRQLGEIGGVVFLRKDGITADASVTITTSRFFASVLSERLGLPAEVMRDTAKPSEFDYFVQYLTASPKPLTFAVPAGWGFVTPGS
jgi:hypothetical protein